MEDAKRIHSLDLIKGILIIFIIITHYNWTDEQRRMMLFPYWIDMAVPVFMIISGYVNVLSYQRKEITTLREAYEYKEITGKLIRYSIPLLMAFAFEVFLYVISGIKIDLSCVLTGGIGPGSFYYPVMIQFVYIYPLIYFAIRNYDLKGLITCGIVNLVFETAKTLYGMPTGEYRFMVLRYIFLIAAGCYLAMGKQKVKNLVLLVLFAIGVYWQYAVYYQECKPAIINEAWATTSCMAALYIIPLCTMFCRSQRLMKIRCGLLELIGRASFNIFLTQMVYFIGAKVIYKIVSNPLVANLLNIVICCTVGTIFYAVESRITKYFIRFLEKHDYFEAQIDKIAKKVDSLITK